MGVIDTVDYAIGAVMRVRRRRRVRGRGGMHNGGHDMVQSGIEADKDGRRQHANRALSIAQNLSIIPANLGP